MSRRIHIERLELDLRGVDPKAAEAATRRLGPSLESALAQRRGGFDSAKHVDAGAVAPSREPQDLASSIAHQVARRVRRS